MAVKVDARCCRFCGKALPKNAYSNAKYCSGPGRTNCKDRAFKQRISDAETVRRWVTMPTSEDGALAAGGGVALRGDRLAAEAAFFHELSSTQGGGQPWQGRLALVKEMAPDAYARLGSVLVEAAVRPLPDGQCRHCLSLQLAGGPASTRPAVDRASQILLGLPCQRCLVQSMRSVASEVAVSTRSMAGRTVPGVTDPATHKQCTRCFQGAAARRSMREGTIPSTNPLMQDYVRRAGAWHREEHTAKLPAGYALTASGRPRVTTWITAT